MSIKALIPVFFFIALSAAAFAQVTGGSTAGTTPGTTDTIPGTTGTIPGTTGTIPGTTGTIPGTTGTIPGTTGTIPGTTSMPPATTPLPNPTTELPSPTTQPPLQSTQPPLTSGTILDFSQDDTNITGRFDGTIDTLDNNAGIADTDSIFTDDSSVPGNEDSFAIGPQAPDTLDSGIFEDDPETPMNDTLSE